MWSSPSTAYAIHQLGSSLHSTKGYKEHENQISPLKSESCAFHLRAVSLYHHSTDGTSANPPCIMLQEGRVSLYPCRLKIQQRAAAFQCAQKYLLKCNGCNKYSLLDMWLVSLLCVSQKAPCLVRELSAAQHKTTNIFQDHDPEYKGTGRSNCINKLQQQRQKISHG